MLRVSEPVRTGHTVRSNEYINNLFYNGDGSINISGTFSICDREGNDTFARAVNIGASGIISLARDTDGNNIRNDIAGVDIACP